MATASSYGVKPNSGDQLAAFYNMCSQLRPGYCVDWEPGIYQFGKVSGDTIDWQRVPRRILFRGLGGSSINEEPPSGAVWATGASGQTLVTMAYPSVEHGGPLLDLISLYDPHGGGVGCRIRNLNHGVWNNPGFSGGFDKAVLFDGDSQGGDLAYWTIYNPYAKLAGATSVWHLKDTNGVTFYGGNYGTPGNGSKKGTFWLEKASDVQVFGGKDDSAGTHIRCSGGTNLFVGMSLEQYGSSLGLASIIVEKDANLGVPWSGQRNYFTNLTWTAHPYGAGRFALIAADCDSNCFSDCIAVGGYSGADSAGTWDNGVLNKSATTVLRGKDIAPVVAGSRTGMAKVTLAMLKAGTQSGAWRDRTTS